MPVGIIGHGVVHVVHHQQIVLLIEAGRLCMCCQGQSDGCRKNGGGEHPAEALRHGHGARRDRPA
jgi:hypothetical protein